MCLFSKASTVLSLLKHKPKVITCYKVVVCNHDKLKSIYHNKIWRPGINKSNASKAYATAHLYGDARLYYGIYVYRSKRAVVNAHNSNIANNKNMGKLRMIAVTANRDDLIGADDTVMLFSKVHLSQKEYDKAIKPRK